MKYCFECLIFCIDGDLQDDFEMRLGESTSQISGTLEVRLSHEAIWRTMCFPETSVSGIFVRKTY